MQAVFMAAGRGSRMKDLTEAIPKALLEVSGRTLLEYKFDALPEEVDEIIVVVGYLGSAIHDRFGGEYFGKKIFYVEQENPVGGTANALWQAQSILKDKFFVMNGDGVYAREDLQTCMRYEWAVGVQKKEHVKTGSVQIKHGRVVSIVENTEHSGGPGYACTNLFFLDTRIFDYTPVRKAPHSPELGLPQTVAQAANDIDIHAVEATFWIEIKDPEDLKKAEELLAPHI